MYICLSVLKYLASNYLSDNYKVNLLKTAFIIPMHIFLLDINHLEWEANVFSRILTHQVESSNQLCSLHYFCNHFSVACAMFTYILSINCSMCFLPFICSSTTYRSRISSLVQYNTYCNNVYKRNAISLWAYVCIFEICTYM